MSVGGGQEQLEPRLLEPEDRWVVMQRSGAESGSWESGPKQLGWRLERAGSRSVNTYSGLETSLTPGPSTASFFASFEPFT